MLTTSKRKPLMITLIILAGIFFSRSGYTYHSSRASIEKQYAKKVSIYLGSYLEVSSPEELRHVTGADKGCKLVDAGILNAILRQNKKNSFQEKMILELEKATPACRFFLLFDLNRKLGVYLIDTRFALLYPSDEQFKGFSPRAIFKQLCNHLDLKEAYEKISSDFLDDKAYLADQPSKYTDKDFPVVLLGEFWFLFMVIPCLDFYLFGLKHLQQQRMAVKLYLFGINLISMLMILTIFSVDSSNSILPSWRELAGFGLNEELPWQIYILIDTARLASFIWWLISIIAFFLARKAAVSCFLPFFYVIATPIAFFLSVIPSPGIHKLAIPFCGCLIMFIKDIAIKNKMKLDSGTKGLPAHNLKKI